jgi:hypothetical protein
MYTQVRRRLASIGLRLSVKPVTWYRFNTLTTDPSSHLAMWIDFRWTSDLPNASSTFVPLFFGGSIQAGTYFNPSLLGATPRQLRAWEYPVRSVPSIDGRIRRCESMIGAPQSECWTQLDLYVMEEVVPAVPVAVRDETRLLSERVVTYSFDAATGYPAFDRIALAPAPAEGEGST